MAPPTHVVRVRNDDTRPFVKSYDGTEYRIEPNREVLVPWEAMRSWFGNPNARDVPNGPEHRRKEVERLKVKWGVHSHPFYTEHTHHTDVNLDSSSTPREYIVGHDRNRNRYMHPNLPRVSVFDAATGDRVFTVLDDPDGEFTSEHVAPGSTSTEQSQQELLTRMKAEIDRLETQIALSQQNPQLAAQLDPSGPGDTPAPTEVTEPDLPDLDATVDDLDTFLGTSDGDEPEVDESGAKPDTPSSTPRKKAAAGGRVKAAKARKET